MTTTKIGFLVIEIEQRSFKIAELEQELDRLKKERDELMDQFKHELFTVDFRGAITEEKQVFED